MEEYSENSQVSSEGDLSSPGPLYRVKVMVMGAPQCGKSTLVQSLLQANGHTFSPSPMFNPPPLHSDIAHSPTERVDVHLWTPFKTHGAESLLSRELNGDEHHLVLEMWDTTGRQVCQSVHGLFLTPRTVCVIVYDVNDPKATDSVLPLYTMVQQKYAGRSGGGGGGGGGVMVVVVVGTKADVVGPPGAATETRQHVVQALLSQHHSYTQGIAHHVEETKALLKDHRPTANDKDRDNGAGTPKPQTTKKKKNQKQSQTPSPQLFEEEEPSDDTTALQQCLTFLEGLARAAGNFDSTLRTVVVSACTGKGLDELRKVLLEAALDIASSPQSDKNISSRSSSSSSTLIQPSTVMLYDHILAMRERDVVMLPWQQFLQVAGGEEEEEEEGEAPAATFEEDVAFLKEVGALMEFHVGHITFPTSSSYPLQGQKEQEDAGRSGTHSAAGSTVTCDALSAAKGQRYVCVHPALFATALCCCLIDDDKKSFRFEAGRFWPKDSGFKHPDPQLLCKVLEAIPQQGLVRECLLPLLWQDYELDEEQVVHMLHVLQGQGVLAYHSDQKTLCEGLAMPFFPRLSVHRCHALPLLGLLPDNRPQLNWTPKPFVGDIQVTWSFHMHAHTGLLERLLAMILYLSRDCSNYHHLWRFGLLLRVGEATVCVEHHQGEGRLDVSCRVNGDELGQERDAMRLLWVTLVPFLVHVRHVLLDWPALYFKETILALGQQFYQDEKVEQEPELHVLSALCLWQRGTRLTFQEGETDHELDIGLLFPFTPEASVLSVESWLRLVMSQTDVILSDASVTMASSLPPQFQEKALKRQSMRNSVRFQKKKKSVEVKWQLQEENNNNNNDNDKSDASTDPANQGSKPTGKEDDQTTGTTTLPTDSTEQQEKKGRVVTDQDEQAEAVRLASGFVAAILASALAEYVAQEAEGDQDGRTLVSTAQIAAARVTAEAALAVQTGDIEGAANAVIDAVNAVKTHNSSSAKPETRNRRVL